MSNAEHLKFRARRRAAALAAVAVLVALAAVIALPGHARGRAAATTRRAQTHRAAARVAVGGPAAFSPSWWATHNAPHVTVALAPGGRTVALPRSFLGFSIEVGDVDDDAGYLGLFKRAFELIHVPGDGPQVLRIGGNSTDQSYWHHRLPGGKPYSFALTRAWVPDVRRIVMAVHARVILGLNAISRSSSMAARLARATVSRLPRGSVIGFEIGNEPDLYRHRFGGPLAADILSGRTLAARHSIFSAPGYALAFAAYEAALRHVAPRVPLAGPSISNPLRGRRWMTALIDDDRSSLGLLTAHRYPLSACFHSVRFPYFPTIARLLSERSSAGMADSVEPAVALAHRNGLRFLLTEFNSVTCLGRAGVSNTFATALWAPDALFEMMRAGVDGVDLHLRTFSINAPFLLGPAGFTARPAMYGLAAFARTLGPGARLAPLSVRGSRSAAGLKVWGVYVGRRELHILVLDKGAGAVRLTLRLRGARGDAVVERLIAPSVRSSQGVTFAGQRLNSRGEWSGPLVTQRLAPGRRRGAGYALAVRGYSAALVSVRLGRR